MSSVDDLIDDLFSGVKPGGTSHPTGGSDSNAKKQSSWDVDSDGDEKPNHRITSKTTGNSSSPTGKQSAGRHNFDEDSDNDDIDARTNPRRQPPRGPHALGAAKSPAKTPPKNGVSAKHSTLFTVPFPNQSSLTGLPCCTNRCFVTNQGVTRKASVPPPTVEELQQVASGKYDASSTPQQMLLRKGAYYAPSSAIGNACVDGGANTAVSKTGGGGCPHIVCRKCNYGVIRLQGAEWVDGGGTVDLYLTVRNFYPDWSRLASSTPVGLPTDEQHRQGVVLAANAHCAAYCCQCSWLTVSCDRAVIETRISDVASYASESNLFATRLPLVAGEKRRPPVWACKGHFLL